MDDNQSFEQKFENQLFNSYWLVLNEWKIVNIFEELLKSIPKEVSEENKRSDSKNCFIWNFIHRALKYVSERDQDYQNMRQYQYCQIFVEAVDVGDVGKWRQKLI